MSEMMRFSMKNSSVMHSFKIADDFVRTGALVD